MLLRPGVLSRAFKLSAQFCKFFRTKHDVWSVHQELSRVGVAPEV
ncbi:hypothetical protein SAMN04490194_3565 [Pseudomonas migulae]|uniref:Uncharacterized protein n=1 Tax=Pseudomonas migulae TaxID=78543 RepID=A0A1H5KZQ4_9PSED|nr:hypothetical protein FBY04_102407 [Pseudomonas sp. SJZ080]SEE69561.1 hypothetical protein SAMN04490194_3565 [Pseudomonas migulae]